MRRVAAAALAAGLLGALSAPLALADIEPPEGASPVVGMAVVGSGGTLWLAGPKANEGVIVNADDGTSVTFSAELRSVQALAEYEDYLWVGDIGDSNGSRESITVHRLNSLEEDSVRYRSYEFEYPDGPRDAQAMAISGRGRIYVISTGDSPGIYRAELEPSRDQVNRLTRVTDAPAGVTDAVFLSDGSTLALRTADGIVTMDAWEWGTKATQKLVGAADGESIASDANDVLYVGGNPTIREQEVPTADSTVTVSPEPSASPSPSPSGTASAGASPSGEAEAPVDNSEAPVQSGTLIALSAAGLLALLAGVVAFVVRN